MKHDSLSLPGFGMAEEIPAKMETIKRQLLETMMKKIWSLINPDAAIQQ